MVQIAIVTEGNRPAFELYDIEKDPYEGNNLAVKKEFAELLETYKQKLRKQQEELDDRAPVFE